MAYYEYNQNNSGGVFVKDDYVAHFVFIEADSAADANSKAEDIGIYFNGCDSGRDCDCCGDRWYSVWDNDKGMPEPRIYGELIESYDDMFTNKGEAYAIVYHANGNKEIYRK